MTGISGTAETATDAELIAAARVGDGPAYGDLYERHVDAASRLARHIVRAPADVDDVVAEAFARVLNAIRNGNGPTEAFRPYLLTTVRRVAFDHLRAGRAQVPSDVSDLPDSPDWASDPALDRLERSLIARAFKSLPERWSAVLWHTEVEQSRPAEVGLLLGLSPNAVAALSYRAREGLRQAYLQLHLSGQARATCVPVAAKLAAHIRGGLSERDARKVDRHLRRCHDCRAAHTELTWINSTLRRVLVPVLLGLPVTAHPAAPAPSGAQTHSPGSTRRHGRVRHPRGPIARHPVLTGTAAVAIAAGVLQFGLGVPRVRSSLPPVRTPMRIIPVGSAVGQPGRPAPEPRRGVSTSPGPTGMPEPTPSASGTATPTPAPTGTPGPTPTGTPSPTPSGTPSPTPTPQSSSPGVALGAKLTVGVQVQGLLGLGVSSTVGVRVGNPGTAATGKLTTSITLPAGVIVIALPASGSGWTCATSGTGVTSCTHARLAAGTTAQASFTVLTLSLGGCGQAVQATAASGGLSATGQSSTLVQCLLGLL